MNNASENARVKILCAKCGGMGSYKHYGECFDCRGTGEMAQFENGVISFQGVSYKKGIELLFTNTHSKDDIAIVTGFFNPKVENFETSTRIFQGTGMVPINHVWFEGVNKRTGGNIISPLHGSLKSMNRLHKASIQQTK